MRRLRRRWRRWRWDVRRWRRWRSVVLLLLLLPRSVLLLLGLLPWSLTAALTLVLLPRRETATWRGRRRTTLTTLIATIVSTAALVGPWCCATLLTILLPRSRCTGRSTLPRLDVRLAVAIALSVVPPNLPWWSVCASELVHQLLVLSVCGVLNAWSCRQIAVVAATRTIRAVASHVASVTTHATDDVGSVIASLWAVVLAVTDFAAVLAGLILVVTKGTVEGGKLAELVALELVLGFRCRGSL